MCESEATALALAGPVGVPAEIVGTGEALALEEMLSTGVTDAETDTEYDASPLPDILGEELALAALLALSTELPLAVDDTLTAPVELTAGEDVSETIELALLSPE